MAESNVETVTVEIGRTPGVSVGDPGTGVRFDDSLGFGNIDLR
jgi:hypothetical protein